MLVTDSFLRKVWGSHMIYSILPRTTEYLRAGNLTVPFAGTFGLIRGTLNSFHKCILRSRRIQGRFRPPAYLCPSPRVP